MRLLWTTQQTHGGWQVFTDGLRSSESRIHGNSWNISTLDTQHPGFALGTLTRSSNQKRSKVDYQSHWPQCITFGRHSYTVVWRTWASKVIYLRGITVGRGLLMCRKDWTGHAPRRYGEISSPKAMSLTYKQRILITYQSSSPYNPKKKKIPQRFEERWATHPDCVNIIQTAWETEVTPGSPMARLFEKIKKCCFSWLGPWGFWIL